MMSVNGGYWGWGLAGIKPVRDSERRPFDLCDHGAVYRHQGPELRRGLSGRLHLRRRRPLHDQPRRVYRLRRLRTRVPGRGHLPRGRSPRRHGELHHQGRRLLRVEGRAKGFFREGLRPLLFAIISARQHAAFGGWSALQHVSSLFSLVGEWAIRSRSISLHIAFILSRMGEESWRTLGREYVYQSPWCAFRVDEVEIPGGSQIEYGVLESGGFASVVPVTGGGDVVLVRQWRQPLGSFTLELPSGGVDAEE